MNQQHVEQWCLLHGYTDPFMVGSRWYAFPPNAVMAIDIDNQAHWLWCLPYPYTLEIAIQDGTLTYTLIGNTVLTASWQWDTSASPFYQHVQLGLMADYVAVNREKVWFHCQPDRVTMLPYDWKCFQTPQAWLEVSAPILSIKYSPQEAQAA